MSAANSGASRPPVDQTANAGFTASKSGATHAASGARAGDGPKRTTAKSVAAEAASPSQRELCSGSTPSRSERLAHSTHRKLV